MQMERQNGYMAMSVKEIPNAHLTNFTTFRLGGHCPVLIECTHPKELIAIIQKLHQDKKHFILIGGGSNLVVSDYGLNYAVIRYLSPSALIEINGNLLTVSASTILDELALYCVENGLGGLNFTSGIPGTVGGAIVGNAGAWGKQVGDFLQSAEIIDSKGHVKTVDQHYFGFEYRHSRLKNTGDIVISVTFRLNAGDPITLAKERADILKMREEKHPNLSTHPCAGSFFRNVEPTSKAERRQAAGWFLEQADGKKLSVGGARIFDKHANIIVKGDNCLAQDVYSLHLKMIDIVEQKFGFKLNREVRFVGKFDQAEGMNPEGFW